MDGFRFTLSMPVRFRDVDAMGHVNNAVYLTYFEAARIPYYLLLKGQPSLVRADMIVAEITCRYLSPAKYGENLIVGVCIEQVRSRSFVLIYRIEEESTGRLVATGRSVQVAYDYATQATKTLPPDFIQAAEAYEGRPLRATP